MIASLCCCCCVDYLLGAKSYFWQDDDDITHPLVQISLISLKGGDVGTITVKILDGSFNYNYVGLDRFGRPFDVNQNSNFSYLPDFDFNTSCKLYLPLTFDKSFEEHFSILVSKILSFEQVLQSNLMYDYFVVSGLEATCRSYVGVDMQGNLIISSVKIATRIAVFEPILLNDAMLYLSEVYKNELGINA